MAEQFVYQILAVLLVSLRITPVLTFSPPFTLMRIPASIRLALSLSLATWLVASFPAETWQQTLSENDLIVIAAGELIIGLFGALALQLAHAAILMAGRTIDIQAGFGLALLADPTSESQMPLIGTVLAYAAAAIFFATSGPADLIAIWATSLQHVPVGSAVLAPDLSVLLGYIASVFAIAMGLVGMVLLTLFLIDLTIAFLSRTVPQMNALLIGFQVKTIAVLVTLPVAISLSGTLFLRLIRLSLETMATMT